MKINLDTNIQFIMQKKLITIEPDTTIVSAAKIMRDKNVGTLLIAISNKLLGILTDRQIVTNGVATTRNLKLDPVEDIMTRLPVTISPEMTCRDVLKLMAKHGYRRLPVEENCKLVGIVSVSDITNKIKYFDEDAINNLRKISCSDIERDYYLFF